MCIPEIIREVVEHLDTQDLAVVSSVNKTWRLEARRKLYQNRRAIIYNFLVEWLDIIRCNNLLDQEPINFLILQLSLRLDKFRRDFNLDLKKELLTIRKQLRKKYNRAVRLQTKLDIEAEKKYRLSNSEYQEAVKKRNIADDHRFETFRDLVNFEYFLIRFHDGFYFTEREIDDILNRLEDLSISEDIRRWEATFDSLLEGDEDPDA